MRIRFGPAGIPLSCKGRTLKDGIEDVHALELNAMEIQLVRAVGEVLGDLAEINELSKELDVSLSVHAPYYMDLTGSPKMVERSIENLKWSAEIAEKLGASVVTTHIGINHTKNQKKTLESVVRNVRVVAMPGAIMPAPLVAPPRVTAPSPRSQRSAICLGTVSVVMIARAKRSPASSEESSARAAASMPGGSFAMGR